MARFYRRGISKIYWKAGTDTAPPPATSVVASGSVDLTDDVAEIAGFAITSGLIPTPDLGSRFTKSIPGEDTTAESTLTFYDKDDATNPIRSALTRDAVGYIALLPYGNTVGKRAEVWVVKVTGVNDQWSAGNDPARYVVTFAILETPNQNDTL
jgi:hypothetical protein